MNRSSITEADVAVTTSLSPDDGVVLRAKTVAAELGVPYCDRSDDSLAEVRAETGRAHLIVMTTNESRIVLEEEVFWFHPNMASTRIEALCRGERDRLSDYAGLSPGDCFLDATCGLGADAIVAAHVVGQGGQVRALERSPILAALVRDGMQVYAHRAPEVVEAMRRVEVVRDDALTHLSQLDDASWDVVYFDPMFEGTLDSSQGLEVVRRLACPDPVTVEMVEQASRVARRCVVMKDRAPGMQLAELGFGDISWKGQICYGRIQVGAAT